MTKVSGGVNMSFNGLLICIIVSVFSNTFAANDYRSKITEQEKDIIVEQVQSLQADLCNCRDSRDMDIDEILDTWEPLISSNIKIFEEIINSLDKFVLINGVFEKHNDPNFLGYAMYMLRLFSQISADAGEPLNNQDIITTLEILRNEYQMEIPAIAKSILSKISRLEVERNRGLSNITIYSTDSSPIVIDLTHPDLLGNQEGNKNKLNTFIIQNGATITFAGANVKFTNCRIGKNTYESCDVAGAGMEFFTQRSQLTGKVDLITKEMAQDAINFLFKKKYQDSGLSPLNIRFSGFNIIGSFQMAGDIKTDQTFMEAVILPGTRDINSFYLKVNVKAVGGLYDENVEVTF